MPLYKDADHFQCTNHSAFDVSHEPLKATPCSGIYACEWCGYEIVVNKGDELPDAQICDEHNRPNWLPTIESGFFNRVKWRLVAAAIQTDAARHLS